MGRHQTNGLFVQHKVLAIFYSMYLTSGQPYHPVNAGQRKGEGAAGNLGQQGPHHRQGQRRLQMKLCPAAGTGSNL